MSKTILLKVETGFHGATHEEEVEYTGQSEKEINKLLSDFFDETVAGDIYGAYEIVDNEDDE